MMCQDRWLEISILTDGEMAEPVAEVMARYITEGIVIESTAVDTSNEHSVGEPIGPLRIYGYIKIDQKLEDTRQKIEQALWYLGRIRQLPEPQYKTIHQTDWSESWRQHYQPIPIGQRLIVVPAWIDNIAENRIQIKIEPGMAFGTGTHPTTQLCLEIIETLLIDQSNSLSLGLFGEEINVIDVGCGSGILAITTAKLGANRVLGVDTDLQAIQSATKNAEINNVQEHINFKLGSLTEIKNGEFNLIKAPLVLVNILAVVIIKLLDEGLADLLTSNGILVLSGILEEQTENVKEAILRNNLQIIHHRQSGDWVAITAKSCK
jgi:ribosomal protein L11 methyltransferase